MAALGLVGLTGCQASPSTTADIIPSPSPSGAGPVASPSAASSASPAATPTTGPATSPTPTQRPGEVLVAVGDIARCDAKGDEATARLAARVNGVIALLGDTAYERGTRRELHDCFEPSWGALRDRIRWVVTGNHDDLTEGGAPLREAFGSAASRDGHTWFSDTLGTWHVIVLDTNCGVVAGGCGADSPQARWLAADLAASSGLCTVALYHHPRFSSGMHGDDEEVATLWTLLSQGGVDLVLNGHEHDYERLVPLDARGRPSATAGMTEVVVGTGGAGLRDFDRPRSGSAARLAFQYGVLTVELRDDGWTSTFLTVDGAIADAASGTCH